MPDKNRSTLQNALWFIVGGIISTGVVTGGQRLFEFDASGNQIQKTVVVDSEINAYVTGTGSTSDTQRYAAVCIANPLAALSPSAGSGTIKRITVENGANPAGAGGDVYLTHDCDDKTSTGHTLLIDNFGTGTGALAGSYTTGTQVWAGHDFIKMTYRKDPTSSNQARVRVEYEDLYGE